MRPPVLPGATSETIRRDNLSVVLREVHVSGPRSRSELVALTGLNRSTVADIVAELGDLGFVRERPGARQGLPGRPSPMVEADPQGAVVLAFGLAVHSLAVSVVGLGGRVLAHERVQLPHARPSLDEALRLMRDIGTRLLDRSGLPERLAGIGVAAVGAVRSTDGFVHVAPNLGWSDVPLARLVEETLDAGVPVVVRNEADLGARAEHLRGAGVGVDDLLYLSCDVGVGGGVVTSGRPLVGASGYAGEVGHLPVNPSGTKCGCGARGCWESEVGQRAMLRKAGRDPDAGPDEVARLLRAADQGDATTLAAFADVGRWLGLGIAGLVNVFDPQVVVLGGLFAGIAPYALPEIEAQLHDRRLAISRETATVVASALGIDAPVLGAAERAFEPLLADPAAVRFPSAAARREQIGAAM